MTRLKVIGIAGGFSMLALVNGTQAQEVHELANRWTQTYNEYDSAALAALYHEDAIVFLHDAPSVYGRAAIQDFWADDMQVNMSAATARSKFSLLASMSRPLRSLSFSRPASLKFSQPKPL